MAPHKHHPIPLHGGNRVVIPSSFFRPVDNKDPRISVRRRRRLKEINARSKVRRRGAIPARKERIRTIGLLVMWRDRTRSGRNHEQVWFNGPNFQEQVHDPFPAAIHSDRFDARVIKRPKIDSRQGDIRSGRDLIDETFQRFLVDDDLFHCRTWLGG